MKNKDRECFRWCHIRHLNPQKKHPQRIKKADRQYILNYSNIIFPVSKKKYNKIEKQNSIKINIFGYEEGHPFPIRISKEKLKNHMNLLLTTKDEKSHHILIKTLTLPFPSLLVLTPFTKEGGFGSSYLKNCCPMNLKFCRILETPLKVLEMLKLFT